ncbi:hypothetical protein C8R45DRAFT_1107839 [Mycena sanguinolenta]|nr:hypothetical protein C8R45DRAFT_1107839 [Mycena sanguinolenta]
MDCAMVAFGDEAEYGKVLEYSERLDESDEDSPDGAQMEHLLRESISFGDGLEILQTQNKLWCSKCQGVDDAFAAFWKAADASLVKICGKESFALGASVVAPFVGEPRNWEDLVKSKAPTRQIRPSSTAAVPFGGALQSSITTEPAQVLKEKQKTRWVSAAEPEEVRLKQESTATSPAAPVAVPAKAYKVFSTLFNATKDEELAVQQSSVAWKEILAAFSQLGFALEKTRGSA